MKTVLCFGDSLVWGGYFSDECVSMRHPFEDRFSNVMQKALGPGVRVIEEGTPARYSAWDGPAAIEMYADANLNGARILPTLLNAHAPIDLVVLFLGTNDIVCGTDAIKPMIPGTAEAASRGLAHLIELTREHTWPLAGIDEAPGILLVAPPRLFATENPLFSDLVAAAMAQSERLAPLYADLARKTECAFFDAGTVIERCSIDGINLDAEAHHVLGNALAPVVRPMLEL